MNVIRNCFTTQDDPTGRGWPNQQRRRSNERLIRRRAVAVWRHYCLAGRSSDEAADDLGIRADVLRHWRKGWALNRIMPEMRGRPIQTMPGHVREAVCETLRELGPRTGLPTLHGLYPEVARGELADLLQRFRHAYWDENTLYRDALYWTRINAVWALDYTDPPLPVDGLYEKILVVRDLASGMLLEALPFEGESADNTVNTLASLFERYSPPLIVKSDNGGTVAGRKIVDFLDRWNVWHLPSPAYTPQYNGSCEAGNGSIKTRAEHLSFKNGRPGQWTCDDVEGARLQANYNARPRGSSGPTPIESFCARTPVSRKDRDSFDKILQPLFNGIQSTDRKEAQTRQKNSSVNAGLRRRAIRKALEVSGILSLRRMRVSQPKYCRFYAKIT